MQLRVFTKETSNFKGALFPNMPHKIINSHEYAPLLCVQGDLRCGKFDSAIIYMNLDMIDYLMFDLWAHDDEDFAKGRLKRQGLCFGEYSEFSLDQTISEKSIEIVRKNSKESTERGMKNKTKYGIGLDFYQDPISRVDANYCLQLSMREVNKLSEKLSGIFSSDSLLYFSFSTDKIDIFSQSR